MKYLASLIVVVVLLCPAISEAACGRGGCGAGGRLKQGAGRVVRLFGRVLPRNR